MNFRWNTSTAKTAERSQWEKWEGIKDDLAFGFRMILMNVLERKQWKSKDILFPLTLKRPNNNTQKHLFLKFNEWWQLFLDIWNARAIHTGVLGCGEWARLKYNGFWLDCFESKFEFLAGLFWVQVWDWFLASHIHVSK
jgi:hypothetical protein